MYFKKTTYLTTLQTCEYKDIENVKITGLCQSLATHRDPTLSIQRIYYESIFVWLADNIWLGILFVGNIWRSIYRTSIRRSIICFVCCCTLIWWCWSRWARLTKLEFFFFLNTLWFIQRRRRGMLLTIPERWLLTFNNNMPNAHITILHSYCCNWNECYLPSSVVSV